jgi:Coenzyme PQQ synthesis protein D (PqqD)
VIDGRFVPALSPGVASVAAESEAVLLEERTGHFHMLSASATLLLDCFDGRTSAGAAAAELADATSAPFERVLDDEIALVSQLHGAGLVEDGRLTPSSAAVLPVPPDPADVPSISWVEQQMAGAGDHTLTFAIAQRRARVRATAPDLLEPLGEVLRTVVIADDPGAPTVSMVVGDRRGPGREMHRVFCGRVEVARTAAAGRLMAAVLGQVDRLLAPPDDLLHLECAVLLDADDRAVFVNDRESISELGDRRLARVGLRRLDLVAAPIDRTNLDLVVPPLRLPVDRDALLRLDAELTLAPDRGSSSERRYPPRALVLLGGKPDHLKVTSPARRLGSLVPLVTRLDGSARGRDLADAGRLAEHCQVERALGFSADEVVEVLERVAS